LSDQKLLEHSCQIKIICPIPYDFISDKIICPIPYDFISDKIICPIPYDFILDKIIKTNQSD